MMRQMRASARWVMGILVVSFVGWMVFDVGMDVTGRSGTRIGDAIGRVNGVKIDAQTFYTAVSEAQEQQRQQFGSSPTTLEDLRALEDAVFENLVLDIILNQELDRRAITITDQQVIDAARNYPPPEVYELSQFQTEGQFDPEKYQRFLAANPDPSFLLGLEARYRQLLPRIKLEDQIASAVHVPTSRLWRMYRDQVDSVSAAVVAMYPPSFIPDTAVSVNEEELESYYRVHRDEFNRPARAWMSYVEVSRRTNETDSAAARERARRILQDLRDGADFAEMASRESADSASRERGGDLGMSERGRFVAPFEEAALALRPGAISDPVPTQFGYHIIRLESKSSDSLHVRHILIPIELAQERLIEVETRADTLDLFAAEQIDPGVLESVAARLGIDVRVAPPVLQGNPVLIDGVPVADAGIWAFDALEGETSLVIETDPAYFVFHLDSLEAEGVPPLDRIRDEVQRAALLEKKREETLRVARELRDRMDSGASLEAAARNLKVPVHDLGPFTRVDPAPELAQAPEAIGLAFGLRVGESGGPVESNSTFYFVQTTSKKLADSSAFEAQLEAQLTASLQAARQQRVQLVLQSLRKMADIVDRRREVQRQQRELAASGLLP